MVTHQNSTITSSRTQHDSILDSPRLHPGLTIIPSWTHHDLILDLPILHLGLTKTLSWIQQDPILGSPRLHLGLTKIPCLIHQWMNTPHKVVHWRLLKLRLHGCILLVPLRFSSCATVYEACKTVPLYSPKLHPGLIITPS